MTAEAQAGDAASTSPWADALLAAAVFAVDPVGTGLVVRARPGAVRDALMAELRRLVPEGAPFRRLPAHATDDRLLGGLDLAATLKAGRPVAERGLMAEAHGGVLIAPMAERLEPGTTAHLAQALDRGEVALERDGLGLTLEARFGLVLLDEGAEPDEKAPAPLADRLAMSLDLDRLGWRDAADPSPLTTADIEIARARLASVEAPDDLPEAFTTAALALGVFSLRAPLLALRVARAAAALLEQEAVDAEAAQIAARLVLGPRATMMPADESEEQPEEPPPPPEDQPDDGDEAEKPQPDKPLEDVVLEAAKAALPDGLLEALAAGLAARQASSSQGHAGALAPTTKRGRPAGTRQGRPAPGVRLNVVETLRAAAPWQPVRRRALAERAARVLVQPDDFRITRFKQKNESVAIFVVDASGSAALQRLAEAKGAVELLLADCYVRRDQVALIAFRNKAAELILPPTRSLTRAKRGITGLAGGGGTPLAAGLDAAFTLAEAVKRKGQTPAVVVLTDGRANIARDGAPGRGQAGADAQASAAAIRLAGLSALLVDVSPRPDAKAKALAATMGAAYLPLPQADAQVLNAAVRAQTGA